MGIPSGALAISPIRSGGDSAASPSTKGRAGAGALYQEHGSGPLVASSTAAASSTLCATTPSTTAPSQPCDSRGTRPRLGFSPTRPQ